MTNPILDTLTKAQELIRLPNAWTTDSYARDEDGVGVPPVDPHATCFCTLGALKRVLGIINDDNTPLYHECINLLCQATGYPDIDIPDYNDDRDTTHTDIMAMFDKARELANASV